MDSLHAYLDPQYSYQTPGDDSGFTLLGEWRWGPCIAAAATGSYVYIGNGGLLQVLDVSEPAVPRIVWETNTGLVEDIKIQGPYAYVLYGATFMILDISVPGEPVVLSRLAVPNPVSAAPNGSVVYVTSNIGVVYVVDVSDPHNPFMRDRIIAGGGFYSRIAARSGYIYVDIKKLIVIK